MDAPVHGDPDSPSSDPAPPPEPGLLEQTGALGLELLGLSHDFLQLAALETLYTGQCLVGMMRAALIMALLLVSAWLSLLGALVLALIQSGLTPSTAMLFGAFANFMLAAAAYAVLQTLAKRAGWSATLRALRGWRGDRAAKTGNSQG